MRSFSRHFPIATPRPESPSDPIHSLSAFQRLPPPVPENDSNAPNANIRTPSTPPNPRNLQANNSSSTYPSPNEHFNRTPHQPYHPASPTPVRRSPTLAFHSSPPSETWSTTTDTDSEEDILYPTAPRPIKLFRRETTRIFQFSEEEGTIYKMPPVATAYEEILIKRGFTVHDEYFVDGLMARVLRICKFRAPLAMFSNYEGKSAEWFISNNKMPLWFFTFLNEDGNIIEYADPDPDRILVWYKSMELAAWMAGTMGSKNGIAVCP